MTPHHGSKLLNPLVSVIIVNWNGERLLDACLRSLLEQTYTNLEIIVVDNGSRDSSVHAIQSRFSTVRVVELPMNVGFTGGSIAGLQSSKGDFIALLNNDTRIENQCVARLVETMLRDQRLGICVPKLIFEGSTNSLNSAGHGLTTAGVGFDRGVGTSLGGYTAPEFVFGASAAAVLYRRAMLDDVGFFDEDFFIYDEDADLNCRAQLAGWKCRFVPDAVVHHVGHATSGRLSDCHVYYHTRNLEFVWIKNMPAPLMLRYAHHKLAHEVGAFVYLCLRHGRWRPYLSAKWDALRMLPSMIRKRRQVQAKRLVSDTDFRQLLTPVFRFDLIMQKARQLLVG